MFTLLSLHFPHKIMQVGFEMEKKQRFKGENAANRIAI
jgi:hypothetical protein